MKCRKQIRKLLSFLAIVCCLAGTAAPALPAAAAGAGDGAAVFTNEPKNSPDLYVTKEVENADPERAFDQFQFVLKRNGEAAGGRTYRLYELDGSGGSREILKKDKVGNIIPFETDSSGVFTLEAGQRACFENIGTGARYEVLELDAYLNPRGADGTLQYVSETNRDFYKLYYRCSLDDEGKRNTEGEVLHEAFTYRPRALELDGYYKVQPVGGTTGERVMPENGDMVNFTNRYTGGGSGETADLMISKTAVWPSGWTAPVTEDFWFRVEIDKRYGLEAYGGEEYTAANPVTQETETARTAADGTFSLKAGWTAVFKDVPAGADYKVYELLDGQRSDHEDPSRKTDVDWPEGWQPVGTVSKTDAGSAVVRSGAVQAPETTVNFTNSCLSFAVTKKLNDNGKPDVDFAFRLTDAGNNGMPGRSYYLYKTTGIPVYYEDLKEEEKTEASGNVQGPEVQEEPQADGSRRHLTMRTTGEDGAFTLKAGQAAVFTGIEEGTSYRVVETGTPSYIQMLPLPEDSGKVYTVNPGEIKILDFTNKKVELEGSLTVLKQVQNETGEGSLNTDENFHFILYQRLKTAEDFRKLGVLAAAPDREVAADEAVAAGLADGTLIRGEEEISRDEEITWNEDAWKTDYSYSDGKEYAVYAPLSGAIYTLPDGLSNPNDKTGPDEKRGLAAGEFTLQAGKTARFDRLDAGSEYLVREVGLTSEYTEDTKGGFYKDIAVTENGESAVYCGQSGELTADGLAFTFVNRFTPEKTDLTITKTDAEGEALAGAEFMLYLEKGRDQENKFLPADLGGATPETFCWRTNENGQVVITDLKLGTYWLYETKAPHNYILLKEPIEIQVARTEEGVLQVTVDGKAVSAGDNWQSSSSTPVGSVTVTDRSTEDGKAQIGITVINSELYELPNSGGMGIYWYLISGMLLMMAAALISYKYQRRGGAGRSN